MKVGARDHEPGNLFGHHSHPILGGRTGLMTSPLPALGGIPSRLSRLDPVTLVLGGARSGKSGFAEQLIAGHRGRKNAIA